MANRVLVVEDDPMLRKGLAALVESQGHGVETADSIAAALAQLEDWGPTHILLDLNLPDGEGTTVLRHVRSASLPVKVAVLSGSANQLMDEAIAMNPEAHFRKPANWDAVLKWIAGS